MEEIKHQREQKERRSMMVWFIAEKFSWNFKVRETDNGRSHCRSSTGKTIKYSCEAPLRQNYVHKGLGTSPWRWIGGGKHGGLVVQEMFQNSCLLYSIMGKLSVVHTIDEEISLIHKDYQHFFMSWTIVLSRFWLVQKEVVKITTVCKLRTENYLSLVQQFSTNGQWVFCVSKAVG